MKVFFYYIGINEKETFTNLHYCYYHKRKMRRLALLLSRLA